jgi:hypothetical protein
VTVSIMASSSSSVSIRFSQSGQSFSSGGTTSNRLRSCLRGRTLCAPFLSEVV